jgi:hypothetical protein
VAGEFYWQVARGQKTFNRDFAKGKALLSMEQTPAEITWSSGSRMEADAVIKAFGLQGKEDLLKRTDAAPVSASSGVGCMTVIVLALILLVFLAALRGCMALVRPAARELQQLGQHLAFGRRLLRRVFQRWQPQMNSQVFFMYPTGGHHGF